MGSCAAHERRERLATASKRRRAAVRLRMRIMRWSSGDKTSDEVLLPSIIDSPLDAKKPDPPVCFHNRDQGFHPDAEEHPKFVAGSHQSGLPTSRQGEIPLFRDAARNDGVLKGRGEKRRQAGLLQASRRTPEWELTLPARRW